MKREMRGLKGYYYTLDEEKVREYMNVPARWKLQWLEDANNFLWKAMDKKTRAIWEKFRRGEI